MPIAGIGKMNRSIKRAESVNAWTGGTGTGIGERRKRDDLECREEKWQYFMPRFLRYVQVVQRGKGAHIAVESTLRFKWTFSSGQVFCSESIVFVLSALC